MHVDSYLEVLVTEITRYNSRTSHTPSLFRLSPKIGMTMFLRLPISPSFFKNPFNMDTKSFSKVMSYDKVNRVDCVVGNLVTPKHISYVITKLNNSTNPRGALFLHKK